MKEVKNPKKPLAYYYSITLIALLLFNIFVAPLLNRQHVEQTDYSTFMTHDRRIRRSARLMIERHGDHVHRQGRQYDL